jgi:hypothetical protein
MPRTDCRQRLLQSPLQRRLLRRRLADDDGIALIVALMAMSLLMALGMALVLTTMTEDRIAGTYRDGTEALYAADAALEWTISDLASVPDWNSILDGSVTSAFADGPPGGVRTLPGGRTLDLSGATNMIRCATAAACGDPDLAAMTEERPWVRNNPRWQLYAYGLLKDMLPAASIDSRMYVVVWVAEGRSERYGKPKEEGQGIVVMLAHAYGPAGVTRAVEVMLAGPAELRVLSWREAR